MSFFNIITYFIIKIKTKNKVRRGLYNCGPDRINWISAYLLSCFDMKNQTRSATQMERYERLKFCQLHRSGVGYMSNEIRNMSQWWNENKIGLECQFSGR